MPRSTARFIAYDLRPAKQAERRILLDFLESAKEGGLPVSDCRYVGMGGFKFYDFILMHRYVGLKKMVSLEHDKKLVDRAQFNRPYSFISVQNSSCGNFIKEDTYKGASIYWLDYDDSLGDDIVDDIQVLGTRMRTGSFAFVTIAADVPSDLSSSSDADRLNAVQEQFGDFAAGLTVEDVEDSAFPKAMHVVLKAALVNAFAGRVDAKFYPALQIIYRDTTNMLTIGGYLADVKTARQVERRLKRSLPFLCGPGQPFKIRNFNLSDRERHLIEFASTKRAGSREGKKLLQLGLKAADLAAYRDLVRFLPRYVETIF